jgi:hypothetical protein
MTRWIMLLSTGLLLSSCCGIGGGCAVGPSAALPAGDGLGPDLANQPPKREPRITGPSAMEAAQRAAEQEAALAKLPKNSPEWWALHDKIQAETDARLSRQLVICTGCLPPPSAAK